MQIDMHYYGVYALARLASLKPEAARTIAMASQYHDLWHCDATGLIQPPRGTGMQTNSVPTCTNRVSPAPLIALEKMRFIASNTA